MTTLDPVSQQRHGSDARGIRGEKIRASRTRSGNDNLEGDRRRARVHGVQRLQVSHGSGARGWWLLDVEVRCASSGGAWKRGAWSPEGRSGGALVRWRRSASTRSGRNGLDRGTGEGTGLRIVDSDTDTLSMIAVVPKFQFFQLFVDHKDMAYHNVLDGIQLTGTPNISSMMTPNSATCNVESSSSRVPPMQQEQQQQNVGHELRRSQRRQAAEGEGHIGLDSGSEDSDCDSDWVDSDNEIGADDDDLFNEWVDETFDDMKNKKIQTVAGQ
ncbi:hypothetical protein ZWY2020_041148 [Hordeum vulgare]|nr:hypothetical protein ZWY2020_041148 [Hordeum vulgare]